MRAVIDGKIQADGVDLLDKRWWASAWLVVREVASRDRLKRLDRQINILQAKIPLAAHTENSQEFYDRLVDELTRQYNLWIKTLAPWAKVDADSASGRRKSTKEWAKEALREWEAIWGDLNDPATKERIQQTVDMLKRGIARKR